MIVEFVSGFDIDASPWILQSFYACLCNEVARHLLLFDRRTCLSSISQGEDLDFLVFDGWKC